MQMPIQQRELPIKNRDCQLALQRPNAARRDPRHAVLRRVLQQADQRRAAQKRHLAPCDGEGEVDHGAAEPGPDDRVNTHSSQDDYSVRTARTDRPCARSNILFY